MSSMNCLMSFALLSIGFILTCVLKVFIYSSLLKSFNLNVIKFIKASSNGFSFFALGNLSSPRLIFC